MKYWPLLWSAFCRKKVRTTITLLSVLVAFLLFGVLDGMLAGFDGMVSSMSAERLRVQNRVNLIRELPIAYLAQVRSISGVRQVTPYAWMGGYYQDPRNQVTVIAVDARAYHECYPEISLTADGLRMMTREPAAAIVGQDLARRFGWKVGDRVPLRSIRQGRDPRVTSWDFHIVALYSATEDRQPANQFLINYDYYDSAISGAPGRTTLLVVVPQPSVNADEVAARIDQRFQNSSDETFTQNEREFGRALVAQLGNARMFVSWVLCAVFFTLLFLTGNTMYLSTRERIPEFAVLKACGIRDRVVTALVVTEAVLLCATGAVIGMALAAILVPAALRRFGVPTTTFSASVACWGLLIAAGVALASVAAPLRRVSSVQVAEALGGV